MCTLVAGAMTACAPSQQQAQHMWNTLDGNPPLIIAHRGASGYLPEHTLEGYALAIDQGADVVEPDLVFTRDGVLVVRHDRYLSTTTDVAEHPEFTARKRSDSYYEQSEGEAREDWWIEDFTLAEVKTLRARQPRESRSKLWDGLYEIPTFDEILTLVTTKAKEAGRPVGVYPETKHPGFFESIGHNFEAPLLTALDGFDVGPVFIQSFEASILKRLKGKTDAKLVQLILEETPGAGPNIPLADISEYADVVGPPKTLVLNDKMLSPGFVAEAHALNISVHPWTYRDDTPDVERGRMYDDLKSDGDPKLGVLNRAAHDANSAIEFELMLAYHSGVDGLFTDFPDTAVRIRDAMNLSNKP